MQTQTIEKHKEIEGLNRTRYNRAPLCSYCGLRPSTFIVGNSLNLKTCSDCLKPYHLNVETLPRLAR